MNIRVWGDYGGGDRPQSIFFVNPTISAELYTLCRQSGGCVLYMSMALLWDA